MLNADIVAALRWIRDNIEAFWRGSSKCNIIRAIRRRHENMDADADTGG